MVQLSLAPVVNEKLFSKHFLEERIKGLSEWQEDERAKIAYEKIKTIYEGKKEVIVTYTDNEAQLEMDFIRPVLKALGHIFGVQAMVQQSAKRPDYAFFDNEGDKTEAFKNKDSDDFYKNAIAVGDAKAWDKNLDKKVGGKDIFENQNPSYQIDFYLRETPPDWGVLTNGGKWRLYFEEVSHRLDTYYEVDLVDILEKDDFESFKYFYLFFRKEAFIPVGDSFLDSIYNQSVRFAEEIGESLEDNVYRALLWMAKGYLNMKTNQLEKNEENVKKVHENSLIFLYRLLFLLYSESKGMLGTEVPRKYANQYSFTKWVDDILNDIDNGNVNPRGGLYNFRLMSIFRLVRGGSEALGIPKEEFYVPAYNGGLFDNEKHPLLRAKKIQDGHLARVVDLLVRAPSKEQEGRGKIDYSDLSLRHLGGIYEGLLEYKPKLANQDMVAVKTKGALKWIPASGAEKDFSEFDEDKRAEQGELYLATDRGERKATGSYYTPDYVVKYIVENAVGPVVEERLKDAKTEEEKTDAILSLKVLDPAMGSGHFLVETVDFLASKLAKVAKGEEKKRDIDWAKRQVARNCIYGVDLNPLATELAKVSLWLNTMAEDKPLSFLDHHLKTGNSLIGADIHKIDRHPKEVESVFEEKRKIGQLALSDFFGKSVRDDIKQLLSVYREMLEVTEEKPEDIKEQEELFQKFEAHPFKKRFDVLSDVHISHYFGNKFSNAQYERLLGVFRPGSDKDWNEVLQNDWIRKASDSVPEGLKLEDNLSDQKRFFHWKLEFPEVFFDIQKGVEKNNPGFDVVIGNPPYLQKKSFSPREKKFILKHFPENTSNVNLATVFMSQARRLTRKRGFHSFIVPKSLLFTKAWEGDRKRLLPNMLHICDVSKAWQEVLLEQVIYVWQNSPTPSAQLFVDICENKSISSGNPMEKDICQYIGAITTKFTPQMRSILERSWKNGEALSKHAELPCGLPYQKKLKESGDFPAIGGDEIWRYQQLGVKGYFNKEDIEDDSEFVKKLEKPHVVLQRIVAHILEPKDHIKIAGTVDTSRSIPVNTITCLFTKKKSKLSPYFICAWFNSRFYSWYAYNFVFSRAIRSMDLYEYFATRVPLPKITFETDESTREELSGAFARLYVDAVQMRSFSKILSFISKLARNRRDIIHDILAYLAKQMIETNKQKWGETKSFLSWVEREIGAPVENLSNKTAIEEYHENTFDKLIEVLKKNKKKLSIDPHRREFQDRLRKEFDESVKKLTPLKAKIQETDALIDQIVYKLYGLTDEEIKTVEESFQ